MLSDFCPKHWKARAVCGCLIAALVTPTIASVWRGDPQAKLPQIQLVASNVPGATGTVQAGSGITSIADATIPGQRYVMVRPDQPRKAGLGPSGPVGDLGTQLRHALTYAPAPAPPVMISLDVVAPSRGPKGGEVA